MIIVEDNFYDNPEEVYQKAISVEYNSGEKVGGHAGQRSIEKYYEEIYIEDTDRINTLLQEEINEAKRKQARENHLEDINGGSK